jgi:endoglucanase
MKRRDFLNITANAALISASGFSYNSCRKSKPVAEVSYSKLPRWRGFNLLEKFTHKPDEWLSVAPHWGMNNESFRKSDFEWIAEFGFDFVRLPMSYRCWCDENDWYKIKEDKLKEIDEALDYGKEFDLHVSINFHRAPGFTINDIMFKPEHREAMSLWDDEEALNACAFHWKLFADRYKDIPNNRLSFNLLNEPVRTTEEKHDRVIRRLVNDIREADPHRLIIIDGYNFMPSFNLIDLKIGQCPRGYAPGELTHYRSTWSGSAVYDQLPTWPMETKDGKPLDRNYLEDRLKEWKELEKKGIGLHVGEWGCYNFTPHQVTLEWMKDNLELWETAGWGWALWNLRGTFGILDSGRKDVQYESFRGHLLDRKMLELLKSH